jgi:hypothetical protein
VLSTTRPDELLARAATADVPAVVIGTVVGDRLVAEGVLDIAVADLQQAMEGRIPSALGEDGY